MKQSTSRECEDQADIRLSWSPQVHHRTYNSPKQEPYPTSNGFNPHGHTPISTIGLFHMAKPHDQFSSYGHTPISTINPVHMATLLYLRPIQTTWPHSYVHDQFSTHYPYSCLHNQSTVLPSTSRFFKCYITWLPASIHTNTYLNGVQQWLAIPP